MRGETGEDEEMRSRLLPFLSFLTHNLNVM